MSVRWRVECPEEQREIVISAPSNQEAAELAAETLGDECDVVYDGQEWDVRVSLADADGAPGVWFRVYAKVTFSYSAQPVTMDDDYA